MLKVPSNSILLLRQLQSNFQAGLVAGVYRIYYIYFVLA